LRHRTNAFVQIDIWIQRRRRRQEWDEMFRHADRSDTGTAAAVRNAKRFVQIQMINVGAVIAE
jgi:hypothetical protein